MINEVVETLEAAAQQTLNSGKINQSVVMLDIRVRRRRLLTRVQLGQLHEFISELDVEMDSRL